MTLVLTNKPFEPSGFYSGQKSRLIATVRFPPHASIVDIQRIRDAMVTNEFDLTGGVSMVKLQPNDLLD